MQEDSEFYFWIKGDVYPFDKNFYFKTSEFTCHCNYPDCKEQKVAKELISRLLDLRNSIQEPITITSGFRCAKYQDQLEKQGANTVVAVHSQHELGNAADVQPARMKIPDLLTIAEKKFNAIGIASNFLHLDLRGLDDGKQRRWYY